MNIKRDKLAWIFTVVFTAAVLVLVMSPASASARSVLPEEVVISDTFYPGYGAPIGQVQRVRGEAVGVHAHAEDQGFRLRPKNRLYKDETIYTLEKGKIRFRLNDGSILSLASETKLELNKSVYNKKKKSRSSFLTMAFGKARFLVVKLANFKRSDFKVKTPTAVCGVRGSDYVVEAAEEVSTFIALEDTTIEVYNPQFPDAEPMVLKDGEMSKVYKGGYPSEPVKLSPEEIKRVKEQFISVAPDESEPEPDEVQADKGKQSGDKKGTPSDVIVPKEVIVQLPEDFETRDADQEDIGKFVESSGITDNRPSMVYDDIRSQANEGDQWPGDFPGTPD